MNKERIIKMYSAYYLGYYGYLITQDQIDHLPTKHYSEWLENEYIQLSNKSQSSISDEQKEKRNFYIDRNGVEIDIEFKKTLSAKQIKRLNDVVDEVTEGIIKPKPISDEEIETLPKVDPKKVTKLNEGL